MLESQHNGSSASYGSLPERQVALSASDEARFWTKVQRGRPTDCWPWLASKSGGKGDWYGQFGVGPRPGRRVIGAHRVAWIIARGPIPVGAHVLHSCDRPDCCNPAHLFLGTHLDNMRDAVAKSRLSVPRPSLRKVTTAQLQDMLALLASGSKQCNVATQFGVSKTFVSLLMKGKRRQYDAEGVA